MIASEGPVADVSYNVSRLDAPWLEWDYYPATSIGHYLCNSARVYTLDDNTRCRCTACEWRRAGSPGYCSKSCDHERCLGKSFGVVDREALLGLVLPVVSESVNSEGYKVIMRTERI